MNFFYDEGLQDEAGQEHYDIVPHGLAPFGFEKTTLAQAMKDKEVHIATDVQPRTALYLSSQKEDCCVIAGWRNNRGRTLVAKRELHTLKDLRGKRIGISDIGDNHHLLLTYWLRDAGVEPETDVQPVRPAEPFGVIATSGNPLGKQTLFLRHRERTCANFLAALPPRSQDITRAKSPSSESFFFTFAPLRLCAR